MTNTEEGGHVNAGAEMGGVQPEAKDGWSVREAARGEEGLSPREGDAYPFQYSCQENFMDRGDWQTTVHGVTKSQTQLSD